MKKIIVIGLSGESIFFKVDHFNNIGETINALSVHTEPGGKGFNQALALHRLGANVSFITALGSDVFSKSSYDFLDKEKIDYYVINKNEKTAVATIITDKNGENQVTVYRGINDTLDINDILKYKEVFENCDYVLIQQEMPLDTTYSIIDYCFENNIKVILNPAPAVLLNKEVFKKIYLITPNEFESKKIFGIKEDENIEKVFEKAKEYKVNNMIITLGKEGCVYYENGNIEYFKARKVKAVDTTGAGDVFNSGLVFSLANGENINNAIKYATIASSISVTRRGIVDAVPTSEEVKKVINNE